MFKPLDMRMVRVIGTKDITESVIEDLHILGYVEIKHLSGKIEEITTNIAGERYNLFSPFLIKLRWLKETLREYLPKIHAHQKVEGIKLREVGLGDLFKQQLTIDSFEAKVKDFLEQNNALKNKLIAIKEKLSLYKKFSYFQDFDFSKLKCKNINFFFGSVKKEKIKQLKEELKEREVDYLLFEGRIPVILAASDIDIEDVLMDFGYKSIEMPETTIEQKIKTLEQEERNIVKQMDETQRMLESIAKKYYKKITQWEKILSRAAERERIVSCVGFSKDLFLLEGWILKRDYKRLCDVLYDKYKDSVFVSEVETTEMPPTILENPKVASPFEFLVKYFSLPSPDEIDPTILLFFFIPFVFGMMVGDVGYGLITLILSYLLSLKFKTGIGIPFIKMLTFSSFPAMLFGVLYDEWFGMTHFDIIKVIKEWGLDLQIASPLYGGFHRLSEVNTLITISVLFGAAHLALGFFLGALNEWHHNKKHAIAKIAWIFLEIGGILTISTMMFSMFPEVYGIIGLMIVAISFLIISYAEGLVGIFEIPGLAANMFSYARIAAVGISGVIIAELINESFIPEPSKGVFLLFIVPVFILLHVFNACLAFFECMVQGGRLNMVEFYSKFFHGGGKKFQPFSIYAYDEK